MIGVAFNMNGEEGGGGGRGLTKAMLHPPLLGIL